ncbi:MAG: hypothetical protein LBG58_16670 [Planctomycetaceae bacterium]|jgi:hypothetical protein|nr:hypothetical protein [Planctomycetaceae bacterium]
MIQELISTSLPKCLNGNPGFGVAAQTVGMAPNVAQAAAALSGYTHLFPAGNSSNPVAYIHIIRNLGGQRRHFVSRVADAGNDYSGRTNRIGHHWIIEEPDDVQKLPCGPAAICAHSSLFQTSYTNKAQELPRGKQIANVPVKADVCKVWQQITGDTGWAAAVAEHIEKGLPVSIVYAPGSVDLAILLQEMFALLSPQIRWRTSFSTYFMKSQETPSDRIQIKCIVKGSEAEPFARTVPNTLLLNLTQPLGTAPFGKYTETARNGQKTVVPPSEVLPPKTVVPTVGTGSDVTFPKANTYDLPEEIFDVVNEQEVPTRARIIASSCIPRKKAKPKQLPWLMITVSVLAVLLLVGVLAVTMKGGKKTPDIASQQPAVEKTVEHPVEKQQEENPEVKPEEKPEEKTEEKTEPEPKENAPEDEPPQPDPAAVFIGKLKPLRDKWDNDVSKSNDIKQMKDLQKELQTLLDNSRDQNVGESLTQGITLKTSIENKISEVQKAQADKEQLQTALENLRKRKYWSDLALIDNKEENKKVKEFDLKLEGVTADVKIGYIPFVLLDETKDSNGNVKKIEQKQEGQKIEFFFSEEKDENKKKIATFEVKDGKIMFQWLAVTDGRDAPYPLSDWDKRLNRILLAKLQITIGKEMHKIPLWQPIKRNDLNLLSDDGVNLWEVPSADKSIEKSTVMKKFLCNQGKENLLVFFDEIQVLEGVEKNKSLPVEKNKLTTFDGTTWYHSAFSLPADKLPLVIFEQAADGKNFAVQIHAEYGTSPQFSLVDFVKNKFTDKKKDAEKNAAKNYVKDIQIRNFKISLVKADKDKDIAAKIIEIETDKEKERKEKEKANEEKKKEKEKDQEKIKNLDGEIKHLSNAITKLDEEIEKKRSDLENLKGQLDENLLLLLESQPK